MLDRGPRAFCPLAAIERIFAGHALSPCIDAVAVNGQQKDSAANRAFEARLEKVDERHLNLAKRDCFNFHSVRRNSPQLFRRIHPLLVPAAQQKLAASPLVALIAQNRQSVSKRFYKLLTLAILHFFRLIPHCGRRLPIINLCRNRNVVTVWKGGLVPSCNQFSTRFDFSHHSATKRSVGRPPCRGEDVMPYWLTV